MAGEPAENVGLVSALRQNVPDGFDFAGSAGGWADSAGLWIGLHEAVYAVLVRPLAGGNRIPEHGGKNRPQSRQIADHAAIHEIVEGRHQSLVEQRVDQFPIGSVPADKQDLFS